MASLLTPTARGAVATIGIVGPRVADLVDRWFTPATTRAWQARTVRRVYFGHWGDAPAEEVIVCLFDSQSLEVHCHGGEASSRRILAALASTGCRVVDWQTWVRAREPDPIASQAWIALSRARTVRTASMLLDQYQGALRAAIERILKQLEEHAADGSANPLTASLEPAQAALRELVAAASLGRHLTEPFRVVLGGPPNAGKSSLMNALLGYQRSIVFEQPGTTRDVALAPASFDGWPVELADTAGLRATQDALESRGVELAQKELARSDLPLLCFDATLPWTHLEHSLLARTSHSLVVHTKCDLRASPLDDRPAGIATSSITGLGLDDLARSISQALVPQPPAAGTPIPFTDAQFRAVQQALACLESGHFDHAVTVLRSLL